MVGTGDGKAGSKDDVADPGDEAVNGVFGADAIGECEAELVVPEQVLEEPGASINLKLVN